MNVVYFLFIYSSVGSLSLSLMTFINKTIFDSFVKSVVRSQVKVEAREEKQANGDAFSLLAKANVINNLIFIKMHFNHPQNTDTQNCVHKAEFPIGMTARCCIMNL
jgi:hypothetical protein